MLFLGFQRKADYTIVTQRKDKKSLMSVIFLKEEGHILKKRKAGRRWALEVEIPFRSPIPPFL